VVQGTVKFWRDDDGWGVIASPAVPDDVWVPLRQSATAPWRKATRWSSTASRPNKTATALSRLEYASCNRDPISGRWVQRAPPSGGGIGVELAQLLFRQVQHEAGEGTDRAWPRFAELGLEGLDRGQRAFVGPVVVGLAVVGVTVA
jgi:hypothetical protein